MNIKKIDIKGRFILDVRKNNIVDGMRFIGLICRLAVLDLNL